MELPAVIHSNHKVRHTLRDISEYQPDVVKVLALLRRFYRTDSAHILGHCATTMFLPKTRKKFGTQLLT